LLQAQQEGFGGGRKREKGALDGFKAEEWRSRRRLSAGYGLLRLQEQPPNTGP